MARAHGLLATLTVASIAASIWLYLDNRALRGRLASAPAAQASAAAGATPVAAAARSADPWTETRSAAARRSGGDSAPKLAEQEEESRLDRRRRRQAEFAAMFGRLDGETDEEYRNRIVPLITAGMFVPRQRVEELRKQVEAQANVTPEQTKQLDAAFEKVYADALDYTNKAIADGVLSPYERNVSGWLGFAGGLGGILDEANSQIVQILSADQVKTISASGFEWAEYLGAKAPWEKLDPPPAPR